MSPEETGVSEAGSILLPPTTGQASAQKHTQRRSVQIFFCTLTLSLASRPIMRG